jgi:KDO2-lipid IV(A) lauroyltransferase
LKQPALNGLLQSLRERSGCTFFERRFDGPLLRAYMSQPGVILGLLSDQSSGRVRVPFLGHGAYTSAAPAIFALRYNAILCTGICYRTGLAHWRIEAGAEIPTRENGQPRPTEAIMLDVNRAFEAAVRRDPANWFWVHDRWKFGDAQNASDTSPSASASASASSSSSSSSSKSSAPKTEDEKNKPPLPKNLSTQ